MIVTLELAPGTVLTETGLSEALECSRTPVREALQRLAQEHLVVAVPHRGVTVADLSVMDFGQLMEAVEGIYCLVGQIAADRATPDQLEALAENISQSTAAEELNDLERVAELDTQFHHLLAESAGNHYFTEIQDMLQHLSVRFVYLGFQRAGTASGSIADHEAILRAVRTGKAEEVVASCRHHCANSRQRMRAAL